MPVAEVVVPAVNCATIDLRFLAIKKHKPKCLFRFTLCQHASGFENRRGARATIVGAYKARLELCVVVAGYQNEVRFLTAKLGDDILHRDGAARSLAIESVLAYRQPVALQFIFKI